MNKNNYTLRKNMFNSFFYTAFQLLGAKCAVLRHGETASIDSELAAESVMLIIFGIIPQCHS